METLSYFLCHVQRYNDNASSDLTQQLHSSQSPPYPDQAGTEEGPIMADSSGRDRGDSVSSSKLDDQGLSDTGTQELSQVVDDLLTQLSTKFSSISSELLSKMDDMSRRLDNLEAKVMQSDRGSGEQGK